MYAEVKASNRFEFDIDITQIIIRFPSNVRSEFNPINIIHELAMRRFLELFISRDEFEISNSDYIVQIRFNSMQ
ncbi:hypothetical protein CL653_03615 [bacterium]|nr:hypothetical protein [bacterium]